MERPILVVAAFDTSYKMMRTKKMWIYTALAVLGIFSVLFFSLGLHRKPQHIQNFEEEEYGRGHPFFEQSGHFPFIEEASLFAQSVDAFLNEKDEGQ
jgi:Na+/H+ antiporter NhaC